MAGRSKFQGTRRVNYATIAGVERSLLQKHFDFLKIETKGNILYCYGECQPSPESVVYSYRIKYDPLHAPKVTVTNPIIEYNDDIHMYPEDNSLCLYHKSDLIWDTSCHLYNTIIPWTQEWFVFYELYKIFGVWLHPEVKHNTNKK